MSNAYASHGSTLHKLAECNHNRNKKVFYVQTENRDNRRKSQGQATTQNQEPRQRSLSTSSASMTRTHRRSLSENICRCTTSPVITVKKSVKEPQPPQRRASLTPHTTHDASSKRYSCPPIGSFRSPSQSSSTSSCSSPPPVKTSEIIGHDPMGWKLQPKKSYISPRGHNRRLSLQISLPLLPDYKLSPTPNSSPISEPDHSTKTEPTKSKPVLKPKPFRRHHSESSAFLKSLANHTPMVTLEDLNNVQLRPIDHVDESDDVFGEENNEEDVTACQCKTPPPVPEKTAMARQIAQLITHSRQCRRCVKTKTNQEEQNAEKAQKSDDHHSQQTKNTGKYSCKEVQLSIITFTGGTELSLTFPYPVLG